MIYFSNHGLSEVASLLPVTLGFAIALDGRARTWQTLLGASLLGFAVLLRLQNAIFCVALVAILLGRRETRAGLQSLGALLAWGLLYGLVDRLTWGGWFQSALGYLQYQYLEGNLAAHASEAPTYYFQVLGTSMLAPSLCILVLGVLALRRAPGLLLTAAAFLAFYVLTPHKELRFIVTDLPLACALAGIGADTARRYVHAAIAPGVMLAASLLSGAGFHQLSFRDIGQLWSAPGASAYDVNGEANRLLVEAGREPDLCGVKVESTARVEARVWTGGYSYLHRQVPFYPPAGPPRDTGLYNYVITTSDRVGSGALRASDGPLALVRLPNPSCVADPNYGFIMRADQ